MRTSRVLLAFGLLVATASIAGAEHEGIDHIYVADLPGAFAGHARFVALSPPIPGRSRDHPRGRNLHASHREGAPPGGCTVSFLEIHSGVGCVTSPVFVAARAPVTRFLAVARSSFPVVQTARTRRHNCFPFFFLHRTRMKHFH